MICGRNILAFACASVLLLYWSHRAEARGLDEILARGAFSICADPDALPFSQRSGAPAGFQIDLAKILADRIGVRLDVDWIALRNAARGANCDAIMGSLAQAHDDEAEEHKPSAGGATNDPHRDRRGQPTSANTRRFARQVGRGNPREPRALFFERKAHSSSDAVPDPRGNSRGGGKERDVCRGRV